MNAAELEALVRNDTEIDISKSGRLLYTVLRPGQGSDVYLLGLNPGGDKEEGYIGKDLKAHQNRPVGWTVYKNEFWKAKRDYHYLQERITWLLESLGQQCETTLASNLIFYRGPEFIEEKRMLREHADQCWPVHEALIRSAGVKVILAYGNQEKGSPYTYLREKNKKAVSDEVWGASGHGNWKVKSFTTELCDQRLLVIGIPHFSWYAVGNHPEVVEWIKRRTLEEGLRIFE